MRCVPSTDGVEVAVHDFGGDGPTLLVVHATGMHGRAYGPVAEHLRDRFHVVAADLRGHGASRAPAGLDYRWSGMADDVLAIVDHLGGGPLAVAGHSMGGASILLAELARPGTFAAAWMYEPILPPNGSIPSPGGRGNTMAAAARRRREVFESRDSAYERYASRPPLSVFDPRALRAYVDHGFVDQADGTVILACRSEVEAQVFEASDNGAFDRLGEIDMEVTVVASGDGMPPAQIASVAVEQLPHGTLEQMDDLTHFGPFEAPERVAASIVAALAR